MAWTASVRLDPDKDDVGVATAVWNEGQSDEFTYTDRAKANAAGAQKFKAAAIAARDAATAKQALETNLAGTLTTIMNS